MFIEIIKSSKLFLIKLHAGSKGAANGTLKDDVVPSPSSSKSAQQGTKRKIISKTFGDEYIGSDSSDDSGKILKL